MNDFGPPRVGSGPLVETDWLANELGASDLRIIDCMVFLYLSRTAVGSEPRAALSDA